MQFRKDIRMKNSSRFSMWFHRPVRIKYSNNWLTNALNLKQFLFHWLIVKKTVSASSIKFYLKQIYETVCLRSQDLYLFPFFCTYSLIVRTSKILILQTFPPKKQQSQNKSKHAQKLHVNVNISDIYTYLSRPPQIRGQQYIVEVNPLQDRLNLNSIWCTACEILTYLSLLSGLWKSRYSGVYLLRLLLIHKTLWR